MNSMFGTILYLVFIIFMGFCLFGGLRKLKRKPDERILLIMLQAKNDAWKFLIPTFVLWILFKGKVFISDNSEIPCWLVVVAMFVDIISFEIRKRIS